MARVRIEYQAGKQVLMLENFVVCPSLVKSFSLDLIDDILGQKGRDLSGNILVNVREFSSLLPQLI